MAFCGNCGKEVEDGIEFCSNCGKNVIVDKVKVNAEEKKSEETSRKVNKKLIGIIAIGVLIVLAVLGISKNNHKKVNLEECISVTFNGYNTCGKAEVNLDEDKFFTAVAKAQGKKVENKDLDDYTMQDLTNAMSYYSLEDAVTLSVEPTENLSNGDEVRVVITYDNEVAKAYGVKFVGEETKSTVDGLQELKEINPFDNLQVTFEGIAPNVSVQYEYSGTDGVFNGSFSADKEEEINIGDVVTISTSVTEETALEQGYKLEQTSKEYTCESADSYVTTYKDIQEDTLISAQKEATDVIESYFAAEADYLSYEGLTYTGSYVLNAKKMTGWNDNIVYLVYSANVSSVEGDFEPTTVFLPVQVNDFITKADGTQTYDKDSIAMVGYDGPSFSWFSQVEGYSEGTAMYNDLITTNKADYTYEVSDELTQYGN